MFSNKTLYKVAILSILVLTFGILSNGGNLVQAQVNTGTTPPPPGAVPPGGTVPPGVTPPPPGGGGAVGTITTPTAAIPSNNVTALHVYDNSTMVLEFGNGTTLASPYSNVWSISFSPAGNQTIGNIPGGVGIAPPVATTPPPGGMTSPPPPPGGAAVPPGAVPPGGMTSPPVATTPPPPGGAVGTITTPTAAIPSNNVTALHVYDNSTMVLEFGNGTTLASPYSNVWSISF